MMEKKKKEKEEEEERKAKNRREREEKRQQKQQEKAAKAKQTKTKTPTREEPDEATDSSSSSSSEEEIDENRCSKCQKRFRVGNERDWIGCEHCPRWYHKWCTDIMDVHNLSRAELADIDWICDRCL